MQKPLHDQVALVAGATRGAGRGIALELAAAGAHVYVTGRSTRKSASEMGRPETIDETAELIAAAGGSATAIRADHLDHDDVRAVAERIADEQGGRLDILVNDIWGGDPLMGDWERPFWQNSLVDGLLMQRLGAETHLVTSWHMGPLLATSGRGVIVEVTDGVSDDYRGNLFYDLVKAQVIRLARAQHADLSSYGGMAVAVTPGFLRSEAMLDHFGVTEATWRKGIVQDPHFALSETPRFVARGVAALLADPDRGRWGGVAVPSWDLAKAYDVDDVDGSRPDWGRYFAEVVLGGGHEPVESYRRA